MRKSNIDVDQKHVNEFGIDEVFDVEGVGCGDYDEDDDAISITTRGWHTIWYDEDSEQCR